MTPRRYVWVLQESEPYEGSYLIGVFATKGDAERYLEWFLRDAPYRKRCNFDIEQWNIQRGPVKEDNDDAAN